MPEPLDDALAALRPLLLDDQRLVRAVAAGRCKGDPPIWRRVELRPVDLKAGSRLQVTAYDERQAHTRNETWDDAPAVVDGLLAEPFGSWHVETTAETVQLRVTKKGEAQVHRTSGPAVPQAARSHDRVKPRLLDPSEQFLAELGLTDAHGRVKPSRQDKYRQVEEMLRALDAVGADAVGAGAGGGDATSRPLQVVDLGCGNGYLTFAAYHFLAGRGRRAVAMTGVDVKAQAREHGTAVAARLGWSDSVRFVEGSAGDTDLGGPAAGAGAVAGPDVVLALHACDTATDEALARAVHWSSRVILAAPCCHHDLQRQLAAAGAVPAPYAVLTRHGILRERFTDVLTDAVRASLLRLVGYRVEVVEFVGSEHTPRNTLIRAVRTGAPPMADQVAEYAALVAAWGVRPRLQTLLGDELAGVLGDAT